MPGCLRTTSAATSSASGRTSALSVEERNSIGSTMDSRQRSGQAGERQLGHTVEGGPVLHALDTIQSPSVGNEAVTLVQLRDDAEEDVGNMSKDSATL